MNDVLPQTTMKQILFCAFIVGVLTQNDISFETSTLSGEISTNDAYSEGTTQTVPDFVPEKNRILCVNNPNFDVSFLNESTNDIILRYEKAKDDEVCELDSLMDQLLPEMGEISNFDLLNATKTESLGETIQIIQKAISLSSERSKILSPLFQKLTPRISPIVYQIQASPKCMSAIVHLLGAVRNNDIWALKFIDASAKLPSGLLDGRLSVVGDYEQCLAALSQGEGTNFSGKFCFLKPIIPHPNRKSFSASHVNISGNIQIPPALADDIVEFLDLFNGTFVRFGVCLPSVCDAAEIETSLNSILYPLIGIPIQIGPDCQTKNKQKTLKEHYSSTNQYQKLAFWIFAGLFGLGIFASFIDAVLRCGLSKSKDETLPEKVDQNGNVVQTFQNTKQKRSIWIKVLMSFSILSNTREMFRIDKKARFASVDFIRFLMLIEIVVMHQYYVALGWSAWPVSTRLLSEDGLFQSVGSALRYAFLRNIHNTDFFFALTGMLITYNTLGAMQRHKGSFNFIWFVISMYLRFYPGVFGAILMYYLLPLAGSGPFWSLLDEYHVETCRRNLIPNLLSYNFYLLDLEEFTKHSMCNIASWWVTSCYHLIVLAPIILLPMYHYRSGGFIWAIFILIGGSILSIAHIVYEEIPFMNQIGAMNSILENSFYSIFYTWPFIHHIGPFVAGMLVGYLLRYAPKLWLGGRIGETILSIIFVGATIFGFTWTERMLRGDVELGDLITGPKEPSFESKLEVYLNVSVGKILFVSGFLWLFYLCCTNRAKWINKHLFTWPWLKPLYSLSMGIYLTNFIPPLYFTFSTREVIEFNDNYILKTLPTNMILTIVLAYILHILFEKPTMNILKIIENSG